MNPLTVGNDKYLVAARGEKGWVRNLRVAGEGELRVGRSVDATASDETLRAIADRHPVFEIGQA